MALGTATRTDAEIQRAVRNIRGVKGVTNLIVVTPPVAPSEIRKRIQDAKNTARAAGSAPAMLSVDNRLIINA